MDFQGGTYTFIGLGNYIELFNDPVFYKALFNTFFYLIIQVPGHDKSCTSARCSHRAEVHPGKRIFPDGHLPSDNYVSGGLCPCI